MPQKTEGSFALEKSLIDHRSYKFFTLENGMRVIVISSLKLGEEPSVDSSSEDDSEFLDESGVPETSDEVEEVCEMMENKSAAALCIQVGSMSDPVEAQGLSHFLEHMVFMGSKKYPMENDFDAYLSKRGGTTNAWTGSEYTLFHFDVKRKHFVKCLDRFAQFFISPLMESGSTDRELSAVHSEFELANARDSSRLQFFLGTLASEDSPFRLFGYGNIKSLREIPQQNGTDVYSLLHKHRQQTYSSHRMTLALHSKDTLENLEKLARDLFSDVPNRSGEQFYYAVPPLDFTRFRDSFNNPSFNKFYKVCPLGDREKLRIVWSLPPLRDRYESTPMGIISSLLGHEGQGSVLALLKEKNLAVSLACGVTPTSDVENSSLCTLFVVYITLTDLGRDNVFDVCLIVFDYLKMLLQSAVASQEKTEGNGTAVNNHRLLETDNTTESEREIHTFDSYLPEYQSTREAAFLYNEPQEPEDTVVHVANMMHLVPPHHVFSGYSLLKQIDISLYVDVLKMFTPDRAAIILLSAHFATNLPKDAGCFEWSRGLIFDIWSKASSFYGRYIPSTLMQQWKNSIPSPVLHLPYKNKYITTDFTLLPTSQDMKEPRDLNEDPDAEERRRFGQLWFQQSTRFQSPKAPVLLIVNTMGGVTTTEKIGEYADSPRNNPFPVVHMTLHVLLNYCLNQTLSTIAYEGGEAGLESLLFVPSHEFNSLMFRLDRRYKYDQSYTKLIHINDSQPRFLFNMHAHELVLLIEVQSGVRGKRIEDLRNRIQSETLLCREHVLLSIPFQCFYQTILDHIVDDQTETSNAHFEAYRDAIRQLYFNEALKPKVLNTNLQFYLLRKNAFLLDDLLSAVRRLTVSDLMAYKQRFFSNLRITAYVHGNLTEKDAISFFDFTVRRTKCVPIEHRMFTDVASLAAGTYQLRVMNCNPSDVNMCVARVHLLGRTDLVRDTYNQLVAYILSEPAFDYLRTKETLSYNVYLRAWRSSPDGNSHSGISVVACSQANNFSASHVAGRLTAFWYRLAPHLLAGIPQDAFQTAVDSLITIKQLEDPNMVTEVDRNWEEILIGEAMFNRREASIKILRTVTKEALLNFFINEYMDPARRRSLLIQVDALPTPNPDYVMPSKPSSLFIKHIKMDADLIAAEKCSAVQVNVSDTIDAIGFDAKLARKVLDQLNSKLLGTDGCSPLDESPVWIDNIRDFRSKLTWEPGRVL
ncbi:Nardilysin [Fasciolopsis buskii]|uniref:Nardilysin n=1 Tax=Fasciolopsis buskii TaxID=27845 RepID=A0A8E0VJI6_9TREM|nr:Nardilysin [Fasciolopsis buski]